MTDAIQTTESHETGVSIAKSEIDRRRKAMDADVWLFMKWVTGHGSEDLARFVRPLAYMLAGDAVRLAACLNFYDSEVVTQIKADLCRREIDWNTRQGIRKLTRLLQRVNNRIARSMTKTTTGKDVLLWKASRDPNISILIVSKSDEAAWEMCESIGKVMKTDAYKRYYGDRLFPQNPDGYITKKWIRMYGRTLATQETIEARGATSQSYSCHYNEIYCDDLTSTEAKMGEATAEDAIRFMSSLHGISIAPRWGGTRYLFNGTIQGPKDDHSKLANNAEYLSVVIPIWLRKGGGKWTAQNMMDDGIPVLPELYDEEAIRQKRADTLANDTLGRISWLQNFLMCAHEAGSMQFTAELLANQFFTWVHGKDSTGKERRLIRRYLYVKDEQGNTLPKRDDAFSVPSGAECRCYRKCKTSNHAYIQFDPLFKPRALGVDQSISKRSTGDRWGVGASCVDEHGHKYQLKGAYDRGYWKMIPAISHVFNRWGGLENPPHKVAIESNTWQGMSTDWMKRSEELQYLARHIEKFSPGHTPKITRIYNDIYSGLEDGTLWLDPEDDLFQKCALDYNAADPDNQDDDELDCVAMSIQAHKHAASNLDDQELLKFAQVQEHEFQRDHDVANWIDTTTNFMEGFTWTN